MTTIIPNPTDWNTVKAYYQATRSYKLTAEHFSLTIAQVKNRAIRGNWGSNDTPNEFSEVSNDTPNEFNEASLDTPNEFSEVSNDTPNEFSEVSNDTPNEFSEVSNEASLDTPNEFNEVSNDTPNEFSEVSNEASLDTPNGSSEVSNEAHLKDAFGSLLLPMLPNLCSKKVEEGKPWLADIAPHARFANKPAYHAHISNPQTKDCVFSGNLGADRAGRIDRENKATTMLAIVGDYDLIMSDDERMKRTEKLSIKPNFISRSFSGGTHALWILERPLPILPGNEMLPALLKIIRKELQLSSAYGKIDLKAFNNPSQYYHAGWDWQLIDEAPIPEATSLLWFDEALSKCQLDEGEFGIKIPLDRVYAAIKERFPERWEGEFCLGARGVRFWDSMASNPSAALVCENGMICFTGPFSFRSWEDILGHQFVSEYKADTIGKALTECYFVNNSFYTLTHYSGGDGRLIPAWQCLNRQNMESYMAQRYNLSTKTPKDGTASPLKEAVSKVITNNSLAAACPLIYRSERIVCVNGEPRLNTSFLRVHKPKKAKESEAVEGLTWGNGFPWIADFLEGLFPDVVQRERFLAAWAYTYRNAYAGTPKNGHVIFVAGEPGSGKNFLSECLYGPSLGGYTDASEHLLGRTRFNQNLYAVGVWTCNDTVTKGDAKERSIFAKALKKMAANQQHVCEAKFKDSSEINWSGRVLVTLNVDPLSLQILPDVEMSNKDKISLFKTSDRKLDDPQAPVIAKKEMGALCYFLLHWEIPEHCVGDARWGVKNYLHPDLYTEAANSSSTASFREILALFAQDVFDSDSRMLEISGSATWFLQQMMLQGGLKDMLRGEVNARSIGKRMSALASEGEFPLEYKRGKTQRVWTIKRSAFKNFTEGGVIESSIDENFPF